MRRLRMMTFLTALPLIFLFASASFAQAQMPDQPDMAVDAPTRSAIIDNAIKLLNESYIFPETAAKMEKALRDHQANKDYDGITSSAKFATTLTEHLQAISHDKHLRVRYIAETVPPENATHEPSPEEIAHFRQMVRETNCGFERAERLPGNIGYLDLRGFNPAEFCADTATAAMNFLSNSDALIIDIRHNGGGDPAMVALITSYLYDGEPVHLNDLYFRTDNSTHQWWTLPYVPGKRLGQARPVYVLTSNRTFSAAEEFTYNLKNLKRATIVGEVTGGGANPGGMRRLSDHFAVFIPTGRAINPITKTNWEGTGVKPDVEVPADNALKVAQISALKKVLETADNPVRKAAINRELDKLQKDLDSGK